MILVFWQACAPEATTEGTTAPNPTSCLAEDIVLSCGTIIDGAFTPLTDGAPLIMVHGPAGGWSLQLEISALNIAEKVATLPKVIFRDIEIDYNQPPGFEDDLEYDPERCEGNHPYVYAYLNPLAVYPEMTQLEAICALAGETFHVEIVVTEFGAEGRTATCAVDVVATLDPADVEYCE